MAAFPDKTTNFLRGMSDFWTRFFKDSPVLAATYDAVQLEIGQTYLDMLADALALSIDDVPLFSRRYFQYTPVREDQVRYAEGAGTQEDRWVYAPPDRWVSAPLLLNRVYLPTAWMEEQIDYDVVDHTLQFRADPFPVDGSPPANFPVRHIEVGFPHGFNEPSVTDWLALGVLRGDTLRLRLADGTLVENQIVLVEPGKLYLGTETDALKTEIRDLAYTVDILRQPYDGEVRGEVVTKVPRLIVKVPLDGDLVHGTRQYRSGSLDFTAIDAYGRSIYLGHYIFINDKTYPENNGVFHIVAINDPATITVDRPAPFYRPPAPGIGLLDTAVLDYDQGGITGPVSPVSHLTHDWLAPTSLVVHGRRAYISYRDGALYDADGELEEGVDYVLDPQTGSITHLTVWQPETEIRADYDWRKQLWHLDQDASRPWSAGTAYVEGMLVSRDEAWYRARTSHLSGSRFDSTLWVVRPSPLETLPTTVVREIPFWATELMLDEKTLYNRFGYLLLGGEQDSTEAYRAFLRSLLQLFTYGPALQRMETAINAMAGLPTIRDDGEVLVQYASGMSDQGTTGQAIGRVEGRGGTLRTSGQITLTGAGFLPDDLLATIEISQCEDPLVNGSYVITSVIGTDDVTVSPTPPTAVLDEFVWHYTHQLFVNRFSCEHIFSNTDAGSWIIIRSADNAANQGSFRIQSVLDPHTVELDAPGGLVDETGLTWELTHSNQQVVTTDKRQYVFPYLVPLREDVCAEASVGLLTFNAFEPLSAAFRVVDYLVDPTWWYSRTIPKELLEGALTSPNRRQVLTSLIPHQVGPIDEAAVGDPGVLVGTDDEGRAPRTREASALWSGGSRLVLGVPIATPADIGQYLVVGRTVPPDWAPAIAYEVGSTTAWGGSEYICHTAHTSAAIFDPTKWASYLRKELKGDYQITGVSNDGLQVTLERFPPPSASPPVVGGTVLLPQDCQLPPRLYRRSVGFVIFDRFLKYHAIRVRIDMEAGELDPGFVRDLTTLMDETRPSHTYVYIDPALQWRDVATITEPLTLGVGNHLVDHTPCLDNIIQVGSPAHVGDNYSYQTGSVFGAFAAIPDGFLIVPLPPAWMIGPYRNIFVFGRFSVGVNASGNPLQEDVDYTFVRSSGVVTVTSLDLAAPNYQFDWVVVYLRNGLPPDQANGESALVVGGADPTTDLPASYDRTADTGLIDRAISITIGP
jgi:hypothetical protein